MNIVSWNANGIANKGDKLNELIRQSNADICVLTETWSRPGQNLPTTWSYWKTVDPPRPGRPAGGVAVLVRCGLKAKLVRRYVSEGCNGVWLRIAGAFDLVALYVRPNIAASEFRNLLTDIHSRACAPLLLAGDFNARHSDWCTSNNPNGSRLSAWATAYKVAVHAPSEPTYISERGRSTIDIFLSRGLTLNKPAVLNGVWNGASDHVPVHATIQSPFQQGPINFVPTGIMLRPDKKDEARKRYVAELPLITEKLNAAQNANDVEEAYGNFVDAVRAPWRCTTHKGLLTCKPMWDNQLKLLAKKRDRLFRRARSTNTPESWREHREVDRLIKKTVARKKRAMLRQKVNALKEVSAAAAQQWLSKAMRRSGAAASVESQDGLPLRPQDFTTHMETKPGQQTIVPPRQFITPTDMEATLLSVITALPNGTAPGPDGIYYEMLQAAPKEVAQLLTKLWNKCGTLTYTPEIWNKGTFVPVFKRGNPQLPKSYRPLCLLSACRKVIERAIVRWLDESFTPHVMQLGFQNNIGSEMAITQALHEMDKGAEWIALLDMKSAYNRVQRDRLQQLCDDVLPQQLSAMVSHLLQPLKVETAGDVEHKEGLITRGVSQGAPASTKLFNIYINPLAEKLANALFSPRCRSPAKLYADDVILLLQAFWQLIIALRICEEWGSLYGMEWAVEPGKSQLLLSKQHAKVAPSIAFAGGIIRSVTTAKYLGVMLTAQGVSEQSTCLRIRNAHATLTSLRNAKLLATGINPKFALTIFRSLLQSQIDYASFLSPCTAEARVAYSSLLSRFFGIVLGIRLKKAQLGKVRLLFQIPSQLLRRKILANQFLDRMKNAANGESEKRKTPKRS